MSELNALARKLDKKRISGVFGTLADVSEQVDRLKLLDASAVPAIARGIDALRRLEQSHRQGRRDRVRGAFRTHSEPFGFSVGSLVGAAGCLMAGFAGYGGTLYYAAGFFVLLAILIVSPIILLVLTE